jgi:hypothetical protein
VTWEREKGWGTGLPRVTTTELVWVDEAPALEGTTSILLISGLCAEERWRAVLGEGARLRGPALLPGRTSSGRMRPWPGRARKRDGEAEEPLGDRHLGSRVPAAWGPAIGMNMLCRAPTPGTVLGLVRSGPGLGPRLRWPTGEKASAGVPLRLPDSDTNMLAASILAASRSSAEFRDFCPLEPPMLLMPGLGVTSPSEAPRKSAELP